MEIKEKFDLDKLFFTSDMHLYHDKVLDFCGRPFKTAKEHDETIINNWNKKVPADGVVFNLGDFIMSSRRTLWEETVKILNGKIYFIPGNHDYHNKVQRKCIFDLFEGRIHDIAEIRIKDIIKIQMCHYPFMYWRRDSIHLHGHVHSGKYSNAFEIVPEHVKRYDVGVDNNDFAPISFRELIDIFDIKTENFLKK